MSATKPSRVRAMQRTSDPDMIIAVAYEIHGRVKETDVFHGMVVVVNCFILGICDVFCINGSGGVLGRNGANRRDQCASSVA